MTKTVIAIVLGACATVACSSAPTASSGVGTKERLASQFAEGVAVTVRQPNGDLETTLQAHDKAQTLLAKQTWHHQTKLVEWAPTDPTDGGQWTVKDPPKATLQRANTLMVELWARAHNGNHQIAYDCTCTQWAQACITVYSNCHYVHSPDPCAECHLVWDTPTTGHYECTGCPPDVLACDQSQSCYPVCTQYNCTIATD